MMFQMFPPVDEALELEPEELGVFVLSHLAELEPNQPGGLNLNNFLISLKQYDPTQKPEVPEAFTDAWMWLEGQRMLAPFQGDRDFFHVTRRGRALLEHGDLEAYRRGNLLRQMELAPGIARKVHPTYLRGDYDTAVFQAFKEVEIYVRHLAGYSNDRYGTRLMRDAFNSESGPLADQSLLQAERQATSDLFAGAIGLLKNPSSHRPVDLDDPQEAAEIILLANYLYRLADRCEVGSDRNGTQD